MARPKTYKKGIRRELVMLLLNIGWIPKTAIKLIPGNTRIIQRKIKIMKEEGIIEDIRDKKVITLQSNTDDILSAEYVKDIPKGYIEKYIENIQPTKKFLSEKKRSSRAIRDSETYIFAYGSKLSVLRDFKPELISSATYTSSGAYYTSREIKQVRGKEEMSKYQSSRINGCVISKYGIYPVYNIGNGTIAWTKLIEEKMKKHIRDIVYEYGYANRTIDSCIVLYRGSRAVYQIMHHRKVRQDTTQYMCIDYMYERMYALPLNKAGEKMLRMMMCDGWNNRIINDFIPYENQIQKKNISVVCDGVEMEENEIRYILLYMIPDINKLKAFRERAKMDNIKERYKVYCYEEQEDVVIRELGDYATIYTVPLDVYYLQYMEDYENYLIKKGDKI